MFKKKSLLILSSIVIGSLILGGCNKGNNEKDPDEGGGGTVIRHDSWANLVSYDYTNLTVLEEATFFTLEKVNTLTGIQSLENGITNSSLTIMVLTMSIGTTLKKAAQLDGLITILNTMST